MEEQDHRDSETNLQELTGKLNETEASSSASAQSRNRVTAAIGEGVALIDGPNIPIELLSLVGQFLLGDNAYASLANYSLTCRALHHELQPILFETVIIKEDEHDWLKNLPVDSSLRAAFKYTKYLITYGNTDSAHSMFPNLEVEVYKHACEYGFRRPRAKCSLRILKSTNIANLAALLRIPLVWRQNTGESWRCPPGNIGQITLEDKVRVYSNLSDGTTEDRFARKASERHRLRTWFVIEHQEDSGTLRETLSALLALVMTTDSVRQGNEQNEQGDNQNPFLGFRLITDVSITHLIPEILEEAFMNGFYPDIYLRNEPATINEAEIAESTDKAIQVYSRVWNQIAKSATRYTDGRRSRSFFRFEHMPNPGSDDYIHGEFSSSSSYDAFTVDLFRIDPDGNDEAIRKETIRLSCSETNALGK